MGDIRATFLAAGRAAARVLADPAVGDRWEQPSGLEHFSVRGLAGHLLRAVAVVDLYLDAEEPPEGATIDAAHYYRAALGQGGAVDLASDLHVSIRQRSEESAALGHAAVVAEMEARLAGLEPRLATEPATRRVSVLRGMALTLDDYLVTRVVELVVHTDDLAVSAGVTSPVPPPEATTVVFAAAVDLARLRHGDLAVLRALTRRERTLEGVLPVF